nr:MAG TPA: hypothetical protein [Microviridae sp.]
MRVRVCARVRACAQRQPQDWGATQGADFRSAPFYSLNRLIHGPFK